MPLYFGHKTDFLSERLYKLMSQGITLRRIYMIDFIKLFYFPLYYEDKNKSRNKFVLDLLDLDGDGNISPKDLVQLEDQIDPQSKAGQEL